MTLNLLMFRLRDGGLRELFGLMGLDAFIPVPLEGLPVPTPGLGMRLAFSDDSVGSRGDGTDASADSSPEISNQKLNRFSLVTG